MKWITRDHAGARFHSVYFQNRPARRTYVGKATFQGRRAICSKLRPVRHTGRGLRAWLDLHTDHGHKRRSGNRRTLTGPSRPTFQANPAQSTAVARIRRIRRIRPQSPNGRRRVDVPLGYRQPPKALPAASTLDPGPAPLAAHCPDNAPRALGSSGGLPRGTGTTRAHA